LFRQPRRDEIGESRASPWILGRDVTVGYLLRVPDLLKGADDEQVIADFLATSTNLAKPSES
jgi:hypothetical protein